MTTEHKKVQTAHYEQSYHESYAKNEIKKYLNANDKFLAKFYVVLTLAIYFKIGEQ